MPTIEEKRVYAEKTGKTEVYVASGAGVVVVDVSDDLVGGFSLEHRCVPRDVAAGTGTAAGDVAVATDEDVDVLAGGEFVGTGFGPAVAVGFDGGDLLAAGEDGRIARLAAGDDGSALDERAWSDVGSVDADVRGIDGRLVDADVRAIDGQLVDAHVRAIDGQFVATDAGLYRVARAGAGGESQELDDAGLTAVNDVSASGMPLAATTEGLYKLGNGWMKVREGDFRVVASDGERAHAATEDTLHADETGWDPVELHVTEPIRGLGYTSNVAVAVTETGTLLIERDDEWRSRLLGVGDVVGLAVR